MKTERKIIFLVPVIIVIVLGLGVMTIDTEWKHVIVTEDNDGFTLYVDGEPSEDLGTTTDTDLQNLLTFDDFQGVEPSDEESEFYNVGYTNWHSLNLSQPTEIIKVPKNVWNPEGIMKVYDLPTKEELPYHWTMQGYYSPKMDTEFWGYDLGDKVIIYDYELFRNYMDYYNESCQRGNDVSLYNPVIRRCEEVKSETEYYEDVSLDCIYFKEYDYQKRIINKGCVADDKKLSISWHSPTICNDNGCGRGYSSATMTNYIVTFDGKQISYEDFKELQDVAWFMIS